MRWTRERCAEAAEEWRKCGSAARAAQTLGGRWGERVSPNGMKCALLMLGISAKSLGLASAKYMTAAGRPSARCDLPSRDLQEPAPTVPKMGTAVAEMGTVAQPRNSSDLGNGQRFPDQEKLPVQEKSVSTGNGLILVVPDLHAPQHSEQALGAVLSLLAGHKFDAIVFLGDISEFASLSWWGGPESLKRYSEESAAVREVLMRFKRLHAGRMLLIEGNHDKRPNQKVEKAAPQLYGSIKDEVGFAELGIEVIAEDAQPYQMGKLRLIHGHQDCGRFPSVYFARQFADLYGMPGQSILVGHTHRSQTFSRRMHGGVTTCYGLGCLEARPTWQRGVSGWTQEVAVCHPASGYVEPLRIIDGAIWFGGKRYAA